MHLTTIVDWPSQATWRSPWRNPTRYACSARSPLKSHRVCRGLRAAWPQRHASRGQLAPDGCERAAGLQRDRAERQPLLVQPPQRQAAPAACKPRSGSSQLPATASIERPSTRYSRSRSSGRISPLGRLVLMPQRTRQGVTTRTRLVERSRDPTLGILRRHSDWPSGQLRRAAGAVTTGAHVVPGSHWEN